jgi:predicted transcriptional regulator
MIETGKQTIEAIKEIKRRTRWSNKRVAEKTGLSAPTIMRLLAGEHEPQLSTMSIIENELKRVRRVHR